MKQKTCRTSFAEHNSQSIISIIASRAESSLGRDSHHNHLAVVDSESMPDTVVDAVGLDENRAVEAADNFVAGHTGVDSVAAEAEETIADRTDLLADCQIGFAELHIDCAGCIVPARCQMVVDFRGALAVVAVDTGCGRRTGFADLVVRRHICQAHPADQEAAVGRNLVVAVHIGVQD